MKRLITFLHSKCRRSVMTLLLLFAAMSGVWAADSNYLRWGIDGQSQSGSISITYDGGGYGTATMKNLDANTTYWFTFVNGYGEQFGNTGYMTSSSCTDWTFTKDVGACHFTTTDAGDYVFNVRWNGSNNIVSITYPTGSTGETAFYLVGDLPDAYWSINDNFKFSPDGTDYSITLKGSAVSGKQFKLKSKTGTTESFIAGPSSENNITLDNPVAFTGDDGKNYVFPQLDSNAEYIMTLTMTSSSAGEFVVKKKDSSSAKYYLIVPNANVGNTNRYVPSEEFAAPAGHKAFRLKASRERNSTVINNDLTTLALKLDGRQLRYNTNGEIEFYIQSSDGTVYMQPKDNDDDKYIKLALKARNDVDYYATRTGTYSSNQNRYYKIRKNDTNPTDGSVDTKTLVFMFSKGNASKTAHINDDTDYNKNVPISNGNSIDGETTGRYDTGKDLKYNVGKTGNLIVGFLMSRGAGSKYYEEHIKGNGLYLVGSIAQTNYTHDKSHPMEKRYWKDGRIVKLSDLGDDEAKADSIVYNCLVRNTGRSWDDFFLSFSTGDVVEGTGLWNLLLRPCVQDQMDAQELGGGVTFYQYDSGDTNNGQSLNPLLSEEQKKNYASYRIYFNATYSTYRIEFYDNFCIAGPAVNGQSKDESKSGIYFDADHRHGMLEETVNGRKCYRYRGEFKKGSTFAFFVNPETSALYYCEDNDNAAVNDNTGDRWHTQAPVDGGVATGADYPYHNKVAWMTDGSSDPSNPALGEGKAILWTLPDGVYTLRFYNHGGNNDSDNHAGALYTIDKEVELKNASSTFEVWNGDKTGKIEKTFEYGGLRTFSDDCALMLPLGVKAYYANSIDEEKGKVILKEVPGNIIPAHCPVIIYDLSMKAGNKGLGRTAVKTINLCPVPGVEKEYTKTLEKMVSTEADKVNYLVDLSTVPAGQIIQPEVDGKYNFCMTNQVNLNGDYSKKVAAPLNFWRAKPGAAAKKNYTYLSVDKDIRPVFYTGAQNYGRPDASEDIANSKRSYCFILSFGDVDDDNVVTGITSVNVNDKTADSNAWYTIQGIRIAAPAVPGMYIHNGKKVVLK